METEEWRGIEGYPRYEVSNLGRVRSWAVQGSSSRKAEKPKILCPIHKKGHTTYLTVNVYNESGRATHLVHQLVTKAFKGERPAGKVCRHINGDSLDNRAGNLKWGTPKQNTADRYLHGTANITSGRVPPVLTDEEVIDIYIRTQQGESLSSIAKDYPHACRETVRVIVVGKARKTVISDFLASLRKPVVRAVAS